MLDFYPSRNQNFSSFAELLVEGHIFRSEIEAVFIKIVRKVTDGNHERICTLKIARFNIDTPIN